MSGRSSRRSSPRPADVFAADAGSRVIWRYSTSGEVLGQIGAFDDRREISRASLCRARISTSRWAAEGLLYGVNPGKLQIAAFTFDGDLGIELGSWKFRW